MDTLNFPDTDGQPTDGTFTYEFEGIIYIWDGEKWTSKGSGGGGSDFSGDYNDLSNQPAIPANTSDLSNDSGFITAAEAPVQPGDLVIPSDATITLTQGGTQKGTFTLNQATGTTIDLDAGGGSSDTFAGDIYVNSMRIGKGKNNDRRNLVFGENALNNVSAGAQYNLAIGRETLIGNTSGQKNTGVGYQALQGLTTGSNNTQIGYYGDLADNLFSPTTESNRVIIGNSSVTNAYIKVAWTVTSDARFKTNFNEVPYGLDFVSQLNPISYRFTQNVIEDGVVVAVVPDGPVLYGFAAQDILALEGDNPVIVDDEDPDHLKYRGEALVPVLVNAIKELSEQVQVLQAEVLALKSS